MHEGTERQTKLKRAQRLWMVGIGGVVVVLAASSVTGILKPPTDDLGSRATGLQRAGESGSDNSSTLPIKPGEPCFEAQQHTLSDLAQVADTPVWMPNAPAASTANLSGAWTCAGGRTPLLTFGAFEPSYRTGQGTIPMPPVEIFYESGYGDLTITMREWCDGLIDQWHVDGHVETMLGYPGCVLPSTGGPGILSEIMIIVDDGVLIRILADQNAPIDDVVAAAESIDLDNPIPR